MIRRRPFLLAGLASPLWPLSATAQQRQSLVNPLRVGVDWALAESGLAKSLQRAFGRDTGIAIQLVPGAALPLLDALERGEIDATLTNAPEAEIRLDQQGLAHDRRFIADSEMVLVGPGRKGRAPDPAGIAGSRDIASALVRISELGAASSASTALTFLSAGDGSGTHLAEQALWRAARVAPSAPWYVPAEKGQSLAAQLRRRGAYGLVERGSWARQGGEPLTPLVEGDPLLAVPVHVMRSFRINHPAGKLFVAWISGPKGRRVVGGQRGYRIPSR